MLEFSKESKEKQGSWEEAGVLVRAAGSARASRIAWGRWGVV